MELHPGLSRFGFGTFPKAGATKEQMEDKFKSDRAKLLTDYCAREFLRAVAYIEMCSKRKTINRKVSSYGLKHRAERYHSTLRPITRIEDLPRVEDAHDPYVSNGAFIAAAIHLGFDIKIHEPNAYFNIGKLKPTTPEATLPIRDNVTRLISVSDFTAIPVHEGTHK